jgi:hypothetical protein
LVVGDGAAVGDGCEVVEGADGVGCGAAAVEGGAGDLLADFGFEGADLVVGDHDGVEGGGVAGERGFLAGAGDESGAGLVALGDEGFGAVEGADEGVGAVGYVVPLPHWFRVDG